MARPPLDQLIQTPLLPLLLRRLSVAVSIAAVVEAISNFVVVVAAEETWMIATCSEETAHLPYRAGRETQGIFLGNQERHVNHVKCANQRGGTRDGSTDETKSVDQTGPTESAILTA